VISAIFALFGVWVLSGNAQSIKAVILLLLLAGIFIGCEFFKRNQIQRVAKMNFAGQNIGLAAFILFIPTLLSVSSSSYGGFKLAPELRSPPTLVHNSNIDSLKTELATLNTSISKQEGTTWKGRVTRDANKNLNQLYKDKSSLKANITTLETADRNENQKIKAGHGTETEMLGYLMAIIGIVMDALLYMNLWAVAKCKYEVVELQQAEHGEDEEEDFDEWLQLVTTSYNSHRNEDSHSDEAIIKSLKNQDTEMLKMALKNAKQNKSAWNNKLTKNLGKKTTNERGLQKWTRIEKLIKQELESRTMEMAG
jgi:hypothetical protein